MAEPNTALVLALSGCSSSGKTTLARLLRDIFPNTFILHEDDFYRPEDQLPVRDGELDWDCAEAINIPSMKEALSYIRQHGSSPPTLVSKEDLNSVGKCPVPESQITHMTNKVKQVLDSSHPLLNTSLRLCILDGFLLFAPSMSAIQSELDMKVFLRASHEQMKGRREARSGYFTLEGFWQDPPGYVDKIVWPNYVEDHAWMFEEGNVEGAYKAGVLEKEGILAVDAASDRVGDTDLGKSLEFCVDVILKEIKKYT